MNFLSDEQNSERGCERREKEKGEQKVERKGDLLECDVEVKSNNEPCKKRKKRGRNKKRNKKSTGAVLSCRLSIYISSRPPNSILAY